jgi:integrase
VSKRSQTTLTNRICNAAEKRSKRYHIWDSELVGFGLRIEATGTKTFIVKYRANGGGRQAEQKIVTIGRLGTLTPELARRKAKAILGGVAVGEDPAADVKAQRRQMKMAALIDLYDAEGCVIQRGKRQGYPMKPRTKAYTMARLRHHVVPLLGRRIVAEITTGDVERFFKYVTEGKTARRERLGARRVIIVRGGDGAARKVFRDLSAVLSFAIRHEIIDRNPCANAAVRKTDNHKDRFLTLAEVQRLGEALNDLAREGTNPKALDIMRLWTLTGCRRDEIAALKWDEIDLERGCLRLADSKTGKSLRPLGVAAMAVLERVQRIEGTDYVFPSETGGGFFQGYKTPWKHAIAMADLPGVSPHTLRHTMGSVTVSTGEAMAFAGAILGHSNPRSTAIYAHVQFDPARQAADRVSARIAAALAGVEAIITDAERERAASDEQLLSEVAKVLANDNQDAERPRALLKLFAA